MFKSAWLLQQTYQLKLRYTISFQCSLMSSREIYDMGTKILYEPSFDHNSTQKALVSIKRRNQFDEIYILAVSKRDLKQSATFFSNICMRPWIRRYPFFLDFCPRMATKVWSLRKYKCLNRTQQINSYFYVHSHSTVMSNHNEIYDIGTKFRC